MRTTLDVAAVTLVPLCARFVSIRTPVPPFVDCATTCHWPWTLAGADETGTEGVSTEVLTDPPPQPAMNVIAKKPRMARGDRSNGRSEFMSPLKEGTAGRTEAGDCST